jgi:DNA topoisomerase-1
VKKVIIVESAAKTKTIRRFLRGEYVVIACGGHIVDLAPGSLGIDVESGFSCTVEPMDQKRVDYLKRNLMDADEIYLAMDPDREGEAIAADIFENCVPPGTNVQRIEFNAIVFHAVREALENPRQIDQNLVSAQRARRSLDRLVGFILSAMSKHDPQGPNLPSVGRVISPAVSLIVDREKERRGFIERRYWTVQTLLDYQGHEIEAAISGEWNNFDEAKKAVEALQRIGSMRVSDCSENSEHFQNPMPPYTTDTLQDDADRLLGFSPEITMKLAQHLYQGVEINGNPQALITYMRTDSTRVSPEALNLAKKALMARKELGGELYFGRTWKPDSSAQDAHEAIRPTVPENPDFFPEALDGKLDRSILVLYRLIYFRFLASQMRPALYHTTHLDFESGGFKAIAEGHRLISAGFLRIYKKLYPEYGLKETDLPAINQDTEVPIIRTWPEMRKTEPPHRYREGALVRELKRRGIGRPSTYGETLKKIKRGTDGYGYVEKIGKTLRPTDRGEKLCEYLHSRYPKVVSYEYTAGMETGLSDIEHGKLRYEEFLDREFTWLRPPYEQASREGWLDKDKPTPAQVKFLKELAVKTSTQISEEVFQSKREVEVWIEKLKKIENDKPKYSISEVAQVDVGAVKCYRVELFVNGNIQQAEGVFLKSKKMKHKKTTAGRRSCFQFTRQDYESVKAIRELLIERYKIKNYERGTF